MRNVCNRYWIVGEQRTGQNRQSRILGAGDADLSLEGHAPLDLQLVHAHIPARGCCCDSSGVSASIDIA